MKVRMLLLCVLCAASLSGADSDTNDVTSVETALLRMEHLKFEAQRHKDSGALDAMLDDAILWVNRNGTLSTKAAYLAGVRDPSIQILRMVPDSMTVKVFEGTAIVAGIYDERGLKNAHSYHQRARFIDTWTFKKGTWVCIAATATSAIT